MLIENYQFERVAVISPVRSEDGVVERFLPQSRYANLNALPLNRYGAGPFCKFSIPRRLQHAGVYLIVDGGSVLYVGECSNLADRFNLGYGTISPRNCFKGGQETNCRINTLIHEAAAKGAGLSLWFHETDDYKTVESILRSRLKAPWNRA